MFNMGENRDENEGKQKDSSNNIVDAEILGGGTIDEETFRLFEIPGKAMKFADMNV